jgi:hypothetical protein
MRAQRGACAVTHNLVATERSAGDHVPSRRSMNGGMDRSNLALAAKLLAKAQDTAFEAEAAALTEKAYVLLAEFLNGVEEGEPRRGFGRRRERRLLHDRRTARRLFGRRSSASRRDAEATYRDEGHQSAAPGGGEIDLRA